MVLSEGGGERDARGRKEGGAGMGCGREYDCEIAR